VTIKVLVVDDSALMRKHLTGLLKGAGFEVALARNGIEAVEQVSTFLPDVVTLDINMPDMDGLTALSLIMMTRPTPTVMVSSLTTKGALATLEALAMGAVDFVAKPGGTISLSMDVVAKELIDKVSGAAKARVKGVRPRSAAPVSAVPTSAPLQRNLLSVPNKAMGLVMIGASTGGPRTLGDILPLLPADFPWPVLVAQHMPASFTGPFSHRMNGLCPLQVREVCSLEPLLPGNIYVARGATDLVVGERSGRLMAISRPESLAHRWHPTVDVMVNSALQHMPPDRLIGVQLTGMGDDGAKAMTELKRRGGRTIAESEESAVVYGMPRELIERGGATRVLPAHKIASQLKLWLN
jgi:two-component system chemotaxis response regulator CheB